MAFRIQSAFVAGELDPALWERTTLDKYGKGLKTLRNAVVGKTGRIISAGGTEYVRASKHTTKASVLFIPKYGGDYVFEIGDLYVRIHNVTAGTYTDCVTVFTEAQLPYLQFDLSKGYFYIACFGVDSYKIKISDGTVVALGQSNLDTPTVYSAAMSSSAGYDVEYVFTFVKDGFESLPSDVQGVETGGGAAQLKLPASTGHFNAFQVYRLLSAGSVVDPTVQEMRVYRRVKEGSAFGYIGSSTNQVPHIRPPSYDWFYYKDLGQDADYTQQPPSLLVAKNSSGLNISPASGKGRSLCFYQQRLIVSEEQNPEAIHASRVGYDGSTGYQGYFNRDYPLNDSCGLTFKSGTSGNAKVLRLQDIGSLVAYTTQGFYTNSGPLGPSNIALEKRGKWVIDERVPPIEIPGTLAFVEKSTGVIQTVNNSAENLGYIADEISIYSNHLFEGKRPVSWAYQEGRIPILWVVLDDGTMNALTWQKEQQLIAWSRHDTDGHYESVAVHTTDDGASTIYFIVNRNGARVIERTTPRYVEDLKDFIGMHSTVTYKDPLSFTVTVNAITPGEWGPDGTLSLISPNDDDFAGADLTIGKIFKFFDSNGTAVNCELVGVIGSSPVTGIIVQPHETFPETEATDAQFYRTFTTLTGLGHLEGKDVSILADGYVVASPNNVNRDIITVDSGEVTLPEDYENSAIVHVGLPYTVDIETLDVDTVEQKPTLLESRLMNAVYVALYKSRGMLVAANFPDNDTNENMVDPEYLDSDTVEDTIGNRCQQPYTRRVEVSVPGDWKSNGRVAIRQVDPLPLEILSIIPDLEIPRR